MTAKLIKGTEIREEILQEIQGEVKEIKEKHGHYKKKKKPHLCLYYYRLGTHKLRDCYKNSKNKEKKKKNRNFNNDNNKPSASNNANQPTD